MYVTVLSFYLVCLLAYCILCLSSIIIVFVYYFCLQDPVPFGSATNSTLASGADKTNGSSSSVLVVHVRPGGGDHSISADSPGSNSADSRYAMVPNNMPVVHQLPSHLKQIDHHYAEIRH